MTRTPFITFPTLETERLLLRQPQADDAAELFSIYADRRIMQYMDMPAMKHPGEATLMLDRWNKSYSAAEGIRWAISLRSTGGLVGIIAYRKFMPERRCAEIGYSLGINHWRKGYAREALQAVLHFGFHTLGLKSIEACVFPQNKASISLLEDKGFVKDTSLKGFYLFDEKLKDLQVYALPSPLP